MAKKAKKEGLPVCVSLVVCEKVLIGDDRTATIVRIIDTVGITPEIARTGLGAAVEVGGVSLFISMKNGDATSKYRLNLNVVDPGGNRRSIAHSDVMPRGDPQSGQNVVAPVRIYWAGPGVYWIELAVGNKRIARTPIQVVDATPEEFRKEIEKTQKKHKKAGK